jgi:hypothetical protein
VQRRSTREKRGVTGDNNIIIIIIIIIGALAVPVLRHSFGILIGD